MVKNASRLCMEAGLVVMKVSPNIEQPMVNVGRKIMELGEAAIEFSLDMTSTTLSESLQEGTKINLNGTMNNGGSVVGTLTLRHDGPTAETGKADWVGVTTVEDGEIVSNTGRGYYYKTGPSEYRVRMLTQVATGEGGVVEGTVTPGSYKGAMFAW